MLGSRTMQRSLQHWHLFQLVRDVASWNASLDVCTTKAVLRETLMRPSENIIRQNKADEETKCMNACLPWHALEGASIFALGYCITVPVSLLPAKMRAQLEKLVMGRLGSTAQLVACSHANFHSMNKVSAVYERSKVKWSVCCRSCHPWNQVDDLAPAKFSNCQEV